MWSHTSGILVRRDVTQADQARVRPLRAFALAIGGLKGPLASGQVRDTHANHPTRRAADEGPGRADRHGDGLRLRLGADRGSSGRAVAAGGRFARHGHARPRHHLARDVGRHGPTCRCGHARRRNRHGDRRPTLPDLRQRRGCGGFGEASHAGGGRPRREAGRRSAGRVGRAAADGPWGAGHGSSRLHPAVPTPAGTARAGQGGLRGPPLAGGRADPPGGRRLRHRAGAGARAACEGSDGAAAYPYHRHRGGRGLQRPGAGLA